MRFGLVAGSLFLSILTAPSAAETYRDEAFPVSLEVPADWRLKHNQCDDRETHASGIVRRVAFFKRYGRAKPVEMLRMTFYASGGRATRPASPGPNVETVDLAGSRWLYNKGSGCYAPQVEGVYALFCLRGLTRTDVFSLSDSDLGRMDESKAEVARVFRTVRWTGTAPDTSAMKRLCPGARPVYLSELPDEDIAAEAECLLRELRRWQTGPIIFGRIPDPGILFLRELGGGRQSPSDGTQGVSGHLPRPPRDRT